MKKIIFVFLVIAVYGSGIRSKDSLQFDVQGGSGQYSRLGCLAICSSQSRELLGFCKVVCDDLDFTDQFDIDLKKTLGEINENFLSKLFDKGTSLYLSFSELEEKKNGEVGVKASLIDTSSKHVLFEKRIFFTQKELVVKGHELSDEIIKQMTGTAGICMSSLTYCKMLGLRQKVVCISDYACKQNRVIVSTRRINIAPSWHTTLKQLFYSQITRENNRLMAVDLKTGRKKVVCSYNGLNMQPAFSADGKRVVICLSGGRGNSDLYLYDQDICKKMGRRVFKQLTGNGANNISPCLLPNGDVLFCSDYGIGKPQVCYLDVKEKKITRLTKSRLCCASPSYCATTNRVLYTRPVNGIFQLFTFSLDDIKNIKSDQITFCGGDKHEPSWSECGKYAVFSMDVIGIDKRMVPQIAALNYLSKKIRVLTKGREPKSYPRWGYHRFIDLI